jgi:hypothetical protein
MWYFAVNEMNRLIALPCGFPDVTLTVPSSIEGEGKTEENRRV